MASGGKHEPLDALVLGAGAAGLAAAREISAAGRRVAVLEARPRAGGRILTLYDPAWPGPVELGAEFVHGEATEVRTACDAARLSVEELPDVHVAVEDGRWRTVPDFYREIGAVLSAAGGPGRDRSFRDYLAARRLPRRRRDMARLFVEGYYAARIDRVSARWLAAGAEGTDGGAARQHRVTAGYAALVGWLLGGLQAARVRVHLNTVATRVAWRRGSAVVECRTVTGRRLEPFRARAVVVTVPLGVLKARAGEAGAIEFAPALAGRCAALGHLEVGNVCKVALRFRERFWDGDRFLATRWRAGPRPPRPGAINFWHDGRLPFPTWWTAAPRKAPLLTAWAGGPRAEDLLGRPEGELIGQSLEALASLMRVSRAWLEARLESWAWHNWRADPFSRGAYSYAAVGGESAASALARPLAGTLFFAGEATEPEEAGTVQGALASGRRAARQLIRWEGRRA